MKTRRSKVPEISEAGKYYFPWDLEIKKFVDTFPPNRLSFPQIWPRLKKNSFPPVIFSF